jgi:type IV fimbrial biogenesis protein FimT
MEGITLKRLGFTLFELLIVLLITSILLAIAIPTFTEQINKLQTKVAMHELLGAIESARSIAVSTNKRTVLLANEGDWAKGWKVFVDHNDNGEINGSETVKIERDKLKNIKVSANAHLQEYVSFIGTGEGRKVGKADSGTFQVGTIKICPEHTGNGYALIISRGGRTRVSNLTSAECNEIDH